jgi:hypothetical protein
LEDTLWHNPKPRSRVYKFCFYFSSAIPTNAKRAAFGGDSKGKKDVRHERTIYISFQRVGISISKNLRYVMPLVIAYRDGTWKR